VKITEIIFALKTTKIILVFCIAIVWHTSHANTPSREKHSLPRKNLNILVSRGFVKFSASWSDVGSYGMIACFLDTILWTKQTLRSICFVQRELPELHLIAAVLSSKMTVGSFCW
jgi:hypothetical protein